MIIIPAIDLRSGKVVRLKQGDYDLETRYSSDAFELARHYRDAGAAYLHVVDLDGARDGVAANRSVIARIAHLPGLLVQSGGGIRSRADFDAARAVGISRVVVGSLFEKDPQEVGRFLIATSVEAVCVALDVREQAHGWFVQTHGWLRDSSTTLEAAIERALALGIKHFLVTDIARDGTLEGPNISLYQRLVACYPSACFQASGGVTSLDDLRALRQAGAHAVVIGKALLEGRFALAEALAC
jgi:phosphoribosylformimino-5-aminoimidazole carboxamide ribotide isomerase